MKRHLLFLTGLVLAAGLSAGCSDSGSSRTQAEETVPVLSEKLSPEEEAMMASAEVEGKTAADPASFETP